MIIDKSEETSKWFLTNNKIETLRKLLDTVSNIQPNATVNKLEKEIIVKLSELVDNS